MAVSMDDLLLGVVDCLLAFCWAISSAYFKGPFGQGVYPWLCYCSGFGLFCLDDHPWGNRH